MRHAIKKATPKSRTARQQIDFVGKVVLGDLRSKTALRLVREWIDLHDAELQRDWELARDGGPIEKVAPLE